MKAAVLYETKQPLVIEEVDLDEPKSGEVLVKVGAAGICRSDRHFMHGDARINLPAILGHEGAGTVEKVGPGVTLTKPGDQVILCFVPACGRCKSCLAGYSNLCDLHMATGPFMLDGTTRLHKSGQDIHHMGKVACFAEYAQQLREGIENMRKLCYAFYNENFSFRDLVTKYPDIAGSVTDCLAGDINKDFSQMFEAISEFCEVPESLPLGSPLEMSQAPESANMPA